MSRWYVAATLDQRTLAASMADIIRTRGGEIVSTWHDEARNTIAYERTLGDFDQSLIAAANLAAIDRANLFVLLHHGATERAGKWIELGAALGRRCFCFVVLVADATPESVPLMARAPGVVVMTSDAFVKWIANARRDFESLAEAAGLEGAGNG